MTQKRPEDKQNAEKSRRFSAGVCFCFVYSFSYFFTEVVTVPLFWYFPLQRRWEFALQPSEGLLMGWYGKVLFSLLIASICSGALYSVLRWRRRQLSPALQGLLDLSAMSSTLFVLYYIARSLAYRVPGGP